MPLKGNIRDINTTQLLNIMNLSRRSGMLTIYEGIPTGEKDAMGENERTRPGSERAMIAFSKGRLVYAQMVGQDNGLVAVLNKAGKLTDEQANVLKQRAKDMTDKALAMRLISAKYVTQADIVNCIKQHMVTAVQAIMTWKEGPFVFEDEQLPASGFILVPVDIAKVIIDLTRVIKETEMLQKHIENLEVALEFPENPREKFKGIHLSVDEWKVVRYVSPKNSIRQIMKALNMSELEIRRIVYGLEQAGLVKIVKPTSSTTNRRGGKRSKADKQVVNKLIDKLKSL